MIDHPYKSKFLEHMPQFQRLETQSILHSSQGDHLAGLMAQKVPLEPTLWSQEAGISDQRIKGAMDQRIKAALDLTIRI